MNNNFDSYLFDDIPHCEVDPLTGGPILETDLSDFQAQNLLGDDYNSSESYSLVVFDDNGDNSVSRGDSYFIDSFSSINFANANASIQLNDQQKFQLGLNNRPNLLNSSNPITDISMSLGLSDNGMVLGVAAVSPTRATLPDPV